MIQFIEVQNGFGIGVISGIHGLEFGSVHHLIKSIGGPDGNDIAEHIVKSLDKNQNFAVDNFKIFFC